MLRFCYDLIFFLLSYLYLVLSQEHTFTMLIPGCFLILYAQHYTCCILSYALCFTCLFLAYTICLPYLLLAVVAWILLYKLVSSYNVL